MLILAPFEAFARDAYVLRVEEDESRLPVRWLAGAQVGARLADSHPLERQTLIRTWVTHAREPDGLWSELTVKGIPLTDLSSALRTILEIGTEAMRGGALNLAYSMTTHVRIACMDRGPVAVRAQAALQQATILNQMGLLEQAYDTFKEAHEDGIRGLDTEVERRAHDGMRRLEMYSA